MKSYLKNIFSEDMRFKQNLTPLFITSRKRNVNLDLL